MATGTLSSATTSTIAANISTIADAYLSHIGALVSENATALAAQYETNATLLYTFPNAVPPHGSFYGSTNITRFYKSEGVPGAFVTNSAGAFFPLMSTFYVANDTYSKTTSHDDNAGNVTSHLIFYSYGDAAGARPEAAYFYDVSFDISYVLQSDRWLISTESLTYNNFSSCAAITLSPDGKVLTCQYGS